MQKVTKFVQEFGSVIAIIALVATLAFQGVSSASTNSRLARQANSVQPIACAAVKSSDDAIEAWLQKEVATGARATDPATAAFTSDLHTALLTAQVKCLTGGK